MTTLTSRRLLLVFLSVGLLFCLLDVLYILAYVMQQHDDFSNNPHNVVAATADQDVAAATVMQDAKDRAVQTLASDWIPATGGGNGDSKEPILKLLEEAVGDVDPETAERLPSAEQVADLYGREPVVLGLESCGRFQAYGGDAAEHFVSTAGTFNTGTNLMAELLIANCVMPARMKKYKTKGVRWQVLWGKHTPVDNEEFRQSHRTYEDLTVTANNMFPAVTVRDPFKWMQSVCTYILNMASCFKCVCVWDVVALVIVSLTFVFAVCPRYTLHYVCLVPCRVSRLMHRVPCVSNAAVVFLFSRCADIRTAPIGRTNQNTALIWFPTRLICNC